MPIQQDIMQKPFWAMQTEEALRELAAPPTGLSEKEAAERRGVFGSNVIRERRRLSKIAIVAHQLSSPLILILIGAGVVTIFLREWVETTVIFASVLVNTALGFWQENKAETVLDVLRSYIRTRTRVKRDGRDLEIDAVDIVPGDLIRIKQGDRIPGDARLIRVNAFETDEAVLTGESLPVEKEMIVCPPETSLAERKCMAYSGTLAVRGYADAVVIATGNATEFGKIASLIASKDREETPLQRSIGRFAAWSGVILGIFTLVLFAVGIYFGKSFYEMFLIAVAVAVSAVPEGLPIALTVILAIGVQRLATRKGIVRKLLAAETLGGVSLILTDKTGTLTQAKMALTAVVPHASSTPEKRATLLADALLNTDVIIENPQDPFLAWRTFGSALEVALVKTAAQEGMLLPEVLQHTKMLDRLPFSSEYKFSATQSIRSNNIIYTQLLGAPELLLPRTTLSDTDRRALQTEISRRALSGERVLGIASKEDPTHDEKAFHDRAFANLEFRGLLSFRDPLRPHIAQSIRGIAETGVKTAIVTGDHPGTAQAVAKEVGIIEKEGMVLTGEDIQNMSDEMLTMRLPNTRVYARVTPEQKMRLVKLYRAAGEVVAVTGDGVNDAPALQGADIGVAVGSGTDVAKSVADLVILDDNFETIVEAIKEGRRILGNIRKVIVYLLVNIFDELFLIGGALLMGIALPLSPLQILFVNIFSDSFPAIAFAFEEGIDTSKEGMRRPRQGIFDRQIRFFILVIGTSTSLLLFLLYLALVKSGVSLALAQTFTFASFASYTLLVAFSLRSLDASIFTYNPFSNRHLTLGVGIGLFLTLLAVYLPWLQRVLGTTPLPLSWLLGVFAVGLFNIAVLELGKWYFRKKNETGKKFGLNIR